MTVKTGVLTIVVVLSNVLGNLALSLGMKAQTVASPALWAHIKTLFSPLVLAGVTLLIIWLLSRLALMSWADLSYVLPVTSIGYVFSVLAGKIFLAEEISGARWAGTLLIVAGTVIVSFTKPKTEADT